MPKRGGYRKKRRTHVLQEEEEALSGGASKQQAPVPKCFVIKRGHVSRSLKILVADWRLLMSPHSGLKLKESTHNKLKDFISVGGVFGLTHLLLCSQTERGASMKFARLPEGPTLTFRILQFSLGEDIRSHQRKSRMSQVAFQKSPLLVMNGFGETQRAVSFEQFPTKLLATFFSNMFPPLHLQSMKTSDCRRVALFHIDKTTQAISIRHYGVFQRPASASKGMRRLLRMKKNPFPLLDEIQRLHDDHPASEHQDDDDVDAILPASHSPPSITTEHHEDEETTASNDGLREPEKIALSLYELGPRMTLELTKVEDGVVSGKVLYHRYMAKTDDELAEQLKKEPELQKKRQLERHAMESAGVKKTRVTSEKDSGLSTKKNTVQFSSVDSVSEDN